MVKDRRIPPEVYDKKYLLSNDLEGYQEFVQGSLSSLKTKQLEMLALSAGISLLEVGFGRGEVLYHCAKRGAKVAGIDYSPDAYEVARETLKDFPDADIKVGDGRDIPFGSNGFQRVYSADVIEHLSFYDQVLMLREMYRVLKPGGFMLVHTAPNTFFTKGVYPLAHPILKLVDKETILVLDQHMEMGKHVHVQEHNIFSLRKLARKASLSQPQIWIDTDVLRSNSYIHTRTLGRNPLVRFAGFLGKLPPVRIVLGNDLYLKCYKYVATAGP